MVEIYADASSVRLELNGKTLETKPVKRYKAMFRTPYAPGVLTAVALDENGREISRHSLRTGGREIRLTVRPERYRELTYLPMEFTDEKGELLPYIERPSP